MRSIRGSNRCLYFLMRDFNQKSPVHFFTFKARKTPLDTLMNLYFFSKMFWFRYSIKFSSILMFTSSGMYDLCLIYSSTMKTILQMANQQETSLAYTLILSASSCIILEMVFRSLPLTVRRKSLVNWRLKYSSYCLPDVFLPEKLNRSEGIFMGKLIRSEFSYVSFQYWAVLFPFF